MAILVESIESTLEKKNFSNDLIGEIEEFLSEGTRELYIGKSNQMSRLLLIQAVGEGPYNNALKKRGTGLHHIALDVLNIDEYLLCLSGSGWLLHPKSISFYKSNKQVYLSRPGTPILMEIKERESLMDDNYLLERLDFPFKEMRLLEGLGCDRLKNSDEIQFILTNDSFGKELWN